MRQFILATALMIVALSAGEVSAQQFPSRPIKVLVSIPPGGAPDLAARLLAQRLTETIGQAVYVENRPGANGNLAGEALANAAPDGYTLMLAGDSMVVINPHIYAKMPFDTLKDIIPVSSIASNQFFLSVNPKLPVNTLPEFVEYARKANPPLFYASGGKGSQHQLGIEMFKQRTGVNLVHVPYRGGGPAGTATVAGETAVVLAGASSAGLLKGGQLRGLATTGRKRSPLFPELPMIGDFYPGYDVTIWLGLFAPAGTPEPIVTRLRNEVQKALVDPELMKKLNVTGALEPLVLPPTEFNDLIRRDHEKYGKVARDVGVKIQ
jgi:tripartite-type tricarboxylate transporter receptor subunit TctC